MAKLDRAAAFGRLKEANHALVIINRLSSDEEFNRSFGAALEAGDASAVGDLLAPMGVSEVNMTQAPGGTLINFNLGVVVCVTITIQVCREF